MKLGAHAPHRAQQWCTHMFVGELRQLLGQEPSDRVMFIRGEVRRCPLPVPHKPGAEAYRLPFPTYVQAAQMHRRVCCYLHAQFLAHLPREGGQLCLACLDVSAGQIPHTRVHAAVRAPVDEQDLTFANQRRNGNDLVHGWDFSALPLDMPPPGCHEQHPAGQDRRQA